jgi:hypothetical protein
LAGSCQSLFRPRYHLKGIPHAEGPFFGVQVNPAAYNVKNLGAVCYVGLAPSRLKTSPLSSPLRFLD